MNILAIIIASAISLAIGMFWYSPKGFGKTWQKITKTKKIKPTNKTWINAIGSELIMFTALALLIQITGFIGWKNGIVLSLLIWLGFIATILFGPVTWQKAPTKMFWIGAMHYLVVLVINGALLATWI